jgi:RND family efflux transporter MFP subunit
MMKTAVALAVGLVVVGCGIQADPVQESQPTASVTTVTVRRQPVELSITAVGTLQPVARVLVASQEEGLVTAVQVREGDRVAAGALVVELDDREVVAELAEARANLDEAAAAWRRVESLHATGLASAQEMDSAVARQRVGAARVDALETRLSFTRITAPVAGVVTARSVEVGDLASPRAPLLELASGRGLLLRVPVSELDVVRLHAGDTAEVSVDALPDLALEGTIHRIFPSADSVSRQVTVELVVAETPRDVRYGFLARAHLVLERIPEAVVVPEAALQRGAGGEHFVWVVEDGRARMREVAVGHRFESRAVVAAGLVEGESVVVEGVARLRDGITVTTQTASVEVAS